MRKIIIAAAALALSGCALLTANSSAVNIAINTGITLTTDLFIQHKGGGTTAGDYAAAQKVIAIAKELEGVAAGNLTVAQFNAALAPLIAKLSGTEQVIALALVQELDLYFQAQIASGGSNPLNATTQAAAKVVLNDVIAAASAFPPS